MGEVSPYLKLELFFIVEVGAMFPQVIELEGMSPIIGICNNQPDCFSVLYTTRVPHSQENVPHPRTTIIP